MEGKHLCNKIVFECIWVGTMAVCLAIIKKGVEQSISRSLQGMQIETIPIY